MNYYASTALLNAISATLSGSAVLIQNPKSKKNITFFFSALSVSLWCYLYTLWQMSDNAASALFWVRLQMMACAFVPVTAYHQVLALFEDTNRKRRQLLNLLYATAVVITLFGFTRYFIPGVEQRLEFPFWPIPSIFIHILFVTLPIPIFFALRLISEEKSRSSPLIQNQLKWLSLAIAIGYGGGCTNCPLWYNIPLRPYLNFTVALYFPIAALIFFKLGVVDIKYFLSRFALFNVAVGMLAIPFIGVAFLLDRDWRILSLITVMTLALPLLFPLLYDWLKQNLLKKGISQVAMESNIEKIKETTYTYDDLAKNIVNSLLSTFPVEMAAVYFYDLTRKEFFLRAQKGLKNPLALDLKYNRSALSLSENDPLIEFLLKIKSVVSLEVLKSDSEKMKELRPVISSLDRIEADICCPFMFDNRIKGLLVLSRKKDNTLFTREDIEAIQAFSKMGEEIMRYIMGMETELRNTTLYSHDMAHDIRSIAQTLELLESPMMADQPAEKIKNLVHQAGAVAHRLHDSFQLNRDRSNLILRSVRGEYERSPLDLRKIMLASFEKFQLQSHEKQAIVKNEISSEALLVLGNEIDLGRMLDNLLGNAFRYIQSKGVVTFASKKLGDTIQITVSDNGEGISKNDLEKIWEMGWQGQDKKGTAGLGLSIVKQIVDLHQGTIKVSSEGLGKGTTFTVDLPVAIISNA